MKKHEYVSLYKQRLDEGQKLYMNKTRTDAHGDPLYAVWPEWIGKTALGNGWVMVSTTEPVGVDKPQRPKTMTEELAEIGEVEKEYNFKDADATATALEIMEARQINPAYIEGTGKNGKITKYDVLKFIENDLHS